MNAITIIFALIGLLLLVAGGIGLFFTHTSLASGSAVWVQGNITYGTFSILGLVIIIMAFLSRQEFG